MRPLNFNSTITVRTDEDLRRAINAAAEREDVSASAFVRRALGTMVGAGGLAPPSGPATSRAVA